MGERSKLADVERPKLGDDLHKHPLIPTMHAVDPQDNLPRPVTAISMEDSKAPALTHDSFICMGDERVFVIRDRWGEICVEVPPDKVRFNHHLGWHQVASHDLTEKQRGVAYVAVGPRVQTNAEFLPVEPLRPACEHYKRVMTAFEGDRRLRHVERVCSAQRGESGEYVSLADQEVFACEHRQPRDFVSEERLRTFDEKKIAAAQVADEDWNPDEPPTRSLRPTGERAHGND